MKPFGALKMRTPASAGSFSFSATVTIASGNVGSDLTNFIVMVNLADMPSGFWSGVKSDGGDIRATDNSGTVIPHDLCSFDSVGHTGVLMVKLASLLAASSNAFKVKCGNAALSALPATNANGRNAVWSDYDIVVGFDGTTTDRTGATRTLSGGFSAASVYPAFLKFADTGTGQSWLSPPSRTQYTIACSYYLTAAVSHHNGLLAYYSSNADRQGLIVRNASPAAIAIWNPTDSWLQPTSTGGSTSTLYRAAAALNNTTDRRLYLNGALLGTDVGATLYPATGDHFGLGLTDGAGEYANAEIGYAYLRNGLLSADWLAAEYANWHNSPGGFYTVT